MPDTYDPAFRSSILLCRHRRLRVVMWIGTQALNRINAESSIKGKDLHKKYTVPHLLHQRDGTALDGLACRSHRRAGNKLHACTYVMPVSCNRT